jgi:hypothetical protein
MSYGHRWALRWLFWRDQLKQVSAATGRGAVLRTLIDWWSMPITNREPQNRQEVVSGAG